MRKFIAVVLSVLALTPSVLSQEPAKMITLEIGLLSTTHVLFTSDLTYVDLAKPDVIAAKVVDASKNMLAIKAKCEFDFVTTVSALEANGTMHTFYVRFNPKPDRLVIDTRVQEGVSEKQVNTQIRPSQQFSGGSGNTGGSAQDKPARKGKTSSSGQDGSPVNGVNVTSSQTSNFGRGNAPTLEEVMSKPAGLYHIVDKSYGLMASCINVYAYSDLTYVIITLKNDSDIGYEAGDAQFTVESRKRSSKALMSDKSVWPKSSYGSLSCPPRSETVIGYTIPKITLQKNELLKIYIYEKGGNRNLFLSLDDKDVNYAVAPF